MFSMLSVTISFKPESIFEIELRPDVQKSLPGKFLYCTCGKGLLQAKFPWRLCIPHSPQTHRLIAC